jgi:adenylate cyclase
VPTVEHLVLAIAHVTTYTQACAAHGDEETFAIIEQYYRSVSDIAAPAGGRVVKFMGDGVLLTFPISEAQNAVAALRRLQEETSELWRRFDDRCSVQVKVGVGSVVRGRLGPPGEERDDIIGDAVNRLIKAPWGDFEMSPEVEQLLQ